MVAGMRVSMVAVAAAVCFFAVCVAVGQAVRLTPQDFEITSMPLLNATLNFKQYAGYLPGTNGTELFFWFVESQRNPAKDPVLFWTNGGPGASSVAYGFWTEHGPFRLTPNATSVELFPYSWNQIANVIYVEDPIGVGFSWSANASRYATCTDNSTSLDNFYFLQNFFEVFSDFKSNPFYLTGESYGGHYVPTLAMRLLDMPNDINMQGFLIGNPGIESDWYYNVDEYAFQTYLWSHGLLPQNVYQASVTACAWDQFLTNCSRDFTKPTAACSAANQAAYKYVPTVWDPYSVLAPTCHESGEAYVGMTTPFLMHLKQRYGIDTTYNPCISQWTPVYMNRPDVIKAVHADAHYERKWPNTPANWKYGSEMADISLLFPQFFQRAPHWRILVVSGDADAAVPFMGTQRWINCLNRPVTKDWRNWMMNGDVAGSVMDWEGISFMTVKGCGHTINTYCPQAGYEYFAHWLEQTGPFAP